MSSLRNVDESDFANVVLNNPSPVLVDFWATWCTPCRGLAPVLDRVAEERRAEIDIVKIDADENGELARRYDVSGLPTLLLFVEGTVVARYLGPRSHRKLNEELTVALEGVGGSAVGVPRP